MIRKTALLKNTALSSQTYRDCMARLAGAVSIATTDGPAGKRGVTVSAVTSVSDNPPTIIFCLNRNREENAWFEVNAAFALNTLYQSQIELARAFAGEGHLAMDDRFALGQWRTLATASPILIGARMSIDCRVVEVRPVHTHYVIMGEVVESFLDDGDGEALIYLERRYRGL